MQVEGCQSVMRRGQYTEVNSHCDQEGCRLAGLRPGHMVNVSVVREKLDQEQWDPASKRAYLATNSTPTARHHPLFKIRPLLQPPFSLTDSMYRYPLGIV